MASPSTHHVTLGKHLTPLCLGVPVSNACSGSGEEQVGGFSSVTSITESPDAVGEHTACRSWAGRETEWWPGLGPCPGHTGWWGDRP